MESMEYILRLQEARLRKILARNKSVLLLGARQTGKTTLTRRFPAGLSISLVRPDVRLRYERDPSLLSGEVEAMSRKPSHRPLVLLDEIQKVPALLDVVQDLIDRGRANFVLTGSSARKLRRGPGVNLLPGRVVAQRLDPLVLRELSPVRALKEYLLYGSLPGIVSVRQPGSREMDLESYVMTYLEEEVRAEAIVRNLGSFARFLEFAASESGQVVNFRKLSQEVGVAHTTIASYYQILEDCLIVERVEPLTKSKTRKKLTKAQKYLFFDLGVRRLAAREGTALSRDTLGLLLEQFIGLELIRSARLSDRRVQIRFWRDPDGPEVDWVIEKESEHIPVEVKWTDSPSSKDIRHLQLFLSEYRNAPRGYVVCQTPRRVKLTDRILAVPWQETDELV